MISYSHVVYACFQVFHSLNGSEELLYEIYTYDIHRSCDGRPLQAVGITHGQCEADGDDAYMKRLRETYFPVGLLRQSLEVSLERGEASVETDRKHILNSIVGRSVAELDLEPELVRM